LGIDDKSNFRIMVVDDQKDITTTFTHILEADGFIVETYNNPFEALNKFRESPNETYSIILIDMKMPGMEGLELYENMQKSDKKMPKIIFMTAYETFYNLLKQSFPEMEEKNFIKKPVMPRDLIIKLRRELQKTN
jgi:two-component system response regulator HydG/two-component system response regulator AtoC